MKKLLVLSTMLFAILVISYGQDSLFFNNSTVVSAKVIEIRPGEVTYKLSSMPDGPVFIVPTKTIQSIKYANGVKQTMAKPVQPVDTVIRRFMFGGGLNMGGSPAKGFYQLVDNISYYNNLTRDIELEGVNVGLRAFLGVRLTSTFDVNLVGEYSTLTAFCHNSNNKGTNFFFNRSSFGLVGNKQFPVARKVDINILGGVMYHFLAVKTDKSTLYSTDCPGFRLQAGVNFKPTKLITLQGLIGGEYAVASVDAFLQEGSQITQSKLDLNYSGLLITFNVIFNK